jgi:hypothetical protein
MNSPCRIAYCDVLGVEHIHAIVWHHVKLINGAKSAIAASTLAGTQLSFLHGMTLIQTDGNAPGCNDFGQQL